MKKPSPHHWFHAPFISSSHPIIIGGCGRSGSTLFRVILDTHSQIICGPESNLFLSPLELTPPGRFTLARNFDLSVSLIENLLNHSTSHSHFIDLFFNHYASQYHKPFWAEKTPKNIYALNYIFDHFPQAHFVHVIRDGRDVVCSLRHHLSNQVKNGLIIHQPRTNPLSACINRWLTDTQAGLKFRGHPHYHEIRYEDLVTHPQTTLTPLLESLGFAWEPQLLDYYQVKTSSRDVTRFPQNPEAATPIFTSSIDRWQHDLSPQDLELILSQITPLMQQLKYL